jgi:pre-rRNA-processing protein RIX1
VVALCKIYTSTHEYQTLVREFTTPTLPTFITSCLNLIGFKPSNKSLDIPSSLTEVVFRSFAILLPRHTTIFRPFISQIRSVAKPHLAPTLSDMYVPSSLKDGARRLIVLLHLTIAKNAGGEEWGKAVRDVVRQVHLTSDLVFRAVVEDWESAVGYYGTSVDVSKQLSGGNAADDDLPPWIGITAGLQRLVGILALLNEYLINETSLPVTIPLGLIVDMITRILSIRIPSSTNSTAYGETRLHPAIDRDERDGLWSGMPQIYVATLQLIITVADRLQGSFVTIAQGFLRQLMWIFPAGKNDSDFRLVSYQATAKILLLIGPNLDRDQSSKLSVVCRSCCDDAYPVEQPGLDLRASSGEILNSNGKRPRVTYNADSFLDALPRTKSALNRSGIMVAASDLLPILISYVPQQYLHVSVRALLEQTVILAHHEGGMLASILHPYVAKNGRTLAGMLPHFSRQFSNLDSTELLLRPRTSLVPSTSFHLQEGPLSELEEEDMQMQLEINGDIPEEDVDTDLMANAKGKADQQHPGLATSVVGSCSEPRSFTLVEANQKPAMVLSNYENTAQTSHDSQPGNNADLDGLDQDSETESIELVMHLDSDSD